MTGLSSKPEKMPILNAELERLDGDVRILSFLRTEVPYLHIVTNKALS